MTHKADISGYSYSYPTVNILKGFQCYLFPEAQDAQLRVLLKDINSKTLSLCPER